MTLISPEDPSPPKPDAYELGNSPWSGKDGERLDRMAYVIFRAAIVEGHCGELLAALFDGAGVTYDPLAGKVIIAPAETIAALANSADGSGV